MLETFFLLLRFWINFILNSYSIANILINFFLEFQIFTLTKLILMVKYANWQTFPYQSQQEVSTFNPILKEKILK